MGLETFGFIDSLNSSNPVGASDPKSQGDDHLRGIKSTLLASFPGISGAVTATHTELNLLDGVTLSTAQINDAAQLSATQSFTGINTFARSAETNVLLQRTGAAADTGIWNFGVASNGGLVARTMSDALAAGYTWLNVSRTTTTVAQLTLTADTEIELNAGTIDINGAVDLSSTLAVGGNISSTGQIFQITHGTPIIRLNENDQTTDNGNWDIRASSASLRFRTLTDAFAPGSEWLIVARSGTTVTKAQIDATEVELNATTLDLNGALDISGQITAASGTFSAPGYSFTGDEDTGFYRSGANGIAVSTGGTVVAAFAANQCQLAATEVDLTCTTLDVNATTLDFAGNVTTPNADSLEVGYKGFPQSGESSAAYSFVLTDAGKHREYTGTGGHTFTIPANASVAFPVGTVLGIVNDGSGDLTVAITTDTLVWSGVGSTGSRTLAANGQCSMLKVDSTKWYISGPGLS